MMGTQALWEISLENQGGLFSEEGMSKLESEKDEGPAR